MEDRDIYVVVAENDQPIRISADWVDQIDDKGPLVFETYINQATKENAAKQILQLNGKYGKCRIARLHFVD